MNNDIVRINDQIDELEKKKQISDKFHHLTDEQRLATILHDNLCTANHTDGCSWDYEKWDHVIAKGIEEETVCDFLSVLKKYA